MEGSPAGTEAYSAANAILSSISSLDLSKFNKFKNAFKHIVAEVSKNNTVYRFRYLPFYKKLTNSIPMVLLIFNVDALGYVSSYVALVKEKEGSIGFEFLQNHVFNFFHLVSTR